jgi:hypothetical protein
MPISFFEGVRAEEREDLSRKNMQRRFYALAAAVKEHETTPRRAGDAADANDEHLYRRLRALCGAPASREHSVA